MLKRTLGVLLILFIVNELSGQTKVENLILITTDGLRWQEIFKGVDTSICNNPQFNENNAASINADYGGPTEKDSREKLFPFLWHEVVSRGQLYGNRSAGTRVDNDNPYWFSYPGYSELLTGYVDERVNSNDFENNPNTTILAYLQQQKGFNGKVAAFGAWDAFNRILNEENSGVPVTAAFDPIGGRHPSEREKVLENMLADSYKPWGSAECLDVFTHYAAMEYLEKHKPKVLYVAYGETDEWAHAGKYKSYLNAAHQVDEWIKEIWEFVQTDRAYKDKTALLITVDHGRGEGPLWTSHGKKIAGASQTWFALLSPNVPPRGEVKTSMQLYQKQLAQLMANLLGFQFKADHPIAESVKEVGALTSIK